MPKMSPIHRLQLAVDNASMSPTLRKELASILYDLETIEMVPKVLTDAAAYMAAHPDIDGRGR